MTELNLTHSSKLIKPPIALNDETYISLSPQELNTCKRICYEYFCEELFVVKSKHKFRCASAVYFSLNHEIKPNCNCEYHFNKTDITPSVLDGGQNIILANWASYKSIICTYNNNIPVNIPSHPYVLLYRNVTLWWLICHSPRYTGIYQTPTGPG